MSTTPHFMRFVFLVTLASMLASCVESGYMREGPGTSLYSANLPQSTREQESYVDHICQQAGFVKSEQNCVIDGARGWDVFVHAGLNDIDRRCDAYLAWLDDQRRSRGPMLQQISDVRTATIAIMTAAGTGVTPIAIAASAFGLASSSYSNFQSRLVLELNQSTVQTIVLSGQQRLRAEILDLRIDNQPTALYVLRQYLRLCTPFYIESQINTTITAFERGGPDAAAMQVPLTSIPRVPMLGPGGPAARLKASAPIERRKPEPTPEVPAYALILSDYNPRKERISYVHQALGAICVRGLELKTPGEIEITQALIAIFEETAPSEMAQSPTVDGKLGEKERELLQSKSCRQGLRNYYEATAFPTGQVNSLLAKYLNRVLAPAERVTSGTKLEAIRGKIAKVRQAVSAQLKQNRLLSNTITPDLVAVLSSLPPAPGE